MAALRASKLVCSAMERITSKTEPILSLFSARPSTCAMAVLMSAARVSMLVVVRSMTARPWRVA
ncbi:hypothetical protein D3C84_984800 [compost metagenome]